ncbi:MAG: hypothetical protein ACHQNV_00500 [Vicinamibacteria bacterium]
MLLGNERGEGRLSGLFWLVGLVAVSYALWNIIPVYMANFSLKDKMNEIARAPRGVTSDDAIRDALWKEVKERRLDGFIQRGCFRVSTVETSRRISCAYDRTEQVLPGLNWTFHFSNDVEQPLIY